MEQQPPASLIPTIKDTVHQLVIGNYAGLVTDGRAEGWSEDTLANVIDQITRVHGALVDLPDEAFERKIALPLDDGGWGIDVHLWTVQGISSYTLVLDISEVPTGIAVHIEGIEVK